MASKILSPALRLSKTATLPLVRSRAFQTSSRLLQVPSSTVPLQQPIGALRGGIFGFLLGSTFTGATAYFYLFDNFRMSNGALLEDIYALQASIQNLHDHVVTLEAKVQAWERETTTAATSTTKKK